MIPRFGEIPVQQRRYTLRPGAYAVLPRDGKLLLTAQMTPEAEVQLPGGGIDPGESAIVALHREVREETGWHIANPRRLGAFRRFIFMPEYDLWAEKLCSIYVAWPVRQVGEIMEDDHIAFWSQPQEALELLENEGDAWWLRRYLSAYLP